MFQKIDNGFVRFAKPNDLGSANDSGGPTCFGCVIDLD
jgi:hypothetical protein